MIRVGRSEQCDLRTTELRRQVHGCGVYSDDNFGSVDGARGIREWDFSAEIDEGDAAIIETIANGHEVVLLAPVGGAGENNGELMGGMKMIGDNEPTLGNPVFFIACSAGVQDGVALGELIQGEGSFSVKAKMGARRQRSGPRG